MTAWLRYDMTCDGQGCTERFTVGSRTAQPMREAAAKIGWSLHALKVTKSGPAKSVDLCPTCTTRASNA